jgi:hypothetical protein
MNFKDPNCNMTCFPLFVDVIYNKWKHVKASLKHPQIKSGSCHGCFNKGKRHIPFHGLAYHHWSDLGGELLSTRKHNPIALIEDKPPQLNVFNRIQWMVALCYAKYNILKELFLSKVCFFVWGSIIEKIKNGIHRWLLLLLGSLGSIKLCHNIKALHLVQLQNHKVF